MKILIKKCSSERYWYKDQVGKEFVVDYEIEDTYRVFVNTDKLKGSFCVLKSDLKIIEQ